VQAKYLPFKEPYRDRERYGGHIYLAMLTDETIAVDQHGDPLKFDIDDINKLRGGASIEEVLAARQAQIAKVEERMANPPQRGRPRK
jgi:hypothetical protein